jgi:hypothetical protein
MSKFFSVQQLVKGVAVAATLSAAFMAAPSFAANVASSNQAAAVNVTVAQTDTTIHQKTRAEVYQELVAAEKSGELARLDQSYGGV